MPQYICQAGCFWRGRLWEPGQSVVVSTEEVRLPENTMVTGKCWRAEADAPATVKPPVAVPPGAIIDAEPTNTSEGEGTNLRAVMVDLCLKNGIEFKKNASLKMLREALAERGIIVN